MRLHALLSFLFLTGCASAPINTGLEGGKAEKTRAEKSVDSFTNGQIKSFERSIGVSGSQVRGYNPDSPKR